MKQFTICIFTFLCLLSCSDKQNATADLQEQQWAAVDFFKVKSEVLKAVNEANAIPHKRLSRESKSESQQEMANELSYLKESKTTDCIAEKSLMNEHQLSQMTDKRMQNRNKKIERECILKAQKDPEVIKLKNEYKKSRLATSESTIYLARTRDFLDKYTLDLIKNYCEDNYLLIVDKKSVISNKNGVVIDITDAIISEIKSEKLIVKKQDVDSYRD